MDTNRLAQAVEFAAIAHDGVYRKGTHIPYIAHCIEAAAIASTMTDQENTIIAAVLHDVVEDTSYTLEDIKERFGSAVSDLVADETEDKMRSILASESWRIRKETFLANLEHAPLQAKIISLSDKLSNMRMCLRTYEEKGDAMWLVFHQKDKREHEWYYRSIYEKIPELKDTDAYKEYVSLCDQVFTK